MSANDFDFDYWSDLAKRDPAAFFAERQKMIADFIASAPAEHRAMLLETQRMIDGTRAEAGTPMKAVRAMMGMMTDHLEAMRGQLELLRDESAELAGKFAKLQS